VIIAGVTQTPTQRACGRMRPALPVVTVAVLAPCVFRTIRERLSMCNPGQVGKGLQFGPDETLSCERRQGMIQSLE
jgi:hypothetical protein